MIEKIALFPLELVVFPKEKLALHIFEKRYQQLVMDCEQNELHFGIPAYINKQMVMGTAVKLDRIVKRYASGASDVVCEGMRPFKLLTFEQTVGDRLYAGGKVEYIDNVDNGTQGQRRRFVILVQELYEVLEVAIPVFDEALIHSFSFAHKIGLSLEQEERLLAIPSELERFAFLIDHLSVTIPVIKQINRTKDLIQLNGHFKNFDPLDFKDYKIEDIE